jgi:hypothetical protein
VTIVTTGSSSPGLQVDRAVLDQPVAEHRLEVSQGELDGLDGVVLVRGG